MTRSTLPAILLVLACLACVGAADDRSRASAISAGFGGATSADTASPPLLDGRLLAGGVILVTLAVAAGLGAVKLRRWRADRRASAGGVARDLSRHMRLSRAQRRCLRAAAAEVHVRHPATLLLCPSLLRQAKGRLGPEFGTDAEMILRRLAA